ncbi:MAG: G-D-S-L family lipolytic protein, partial [Chitinophagaceae bacterium]
MKKIAFILLLTVFITGTAMHTATKKKIVFFGDSITQMGVNEGGYIDLLKKYSLAKGLDKQYELTGAGVG